MTISSDILGLSPVLYWKLDDATGPAASDSSGHGKAGAYGGSFVLGQYGPEPGTTAVQFATGGQVTILNMPQLQSVGWSALWYMSVNVQTTPASGDIMVAGARASNRGTFTNMRSSFDFCEVIGNTQNVLQNTAFVTIPVWNKWWHAYAVTYNGNNTVAHYVDGVSQGNITATSGFQYRPSLATDPLGIIGVYPMVVAHFAFFDKQLTDPQINTIASHRWDWPFGPMLDKIWPSPPGGSLSASDPVVVDLNQDLSDIRSAVMHDYTVGPPP